MSLVKRLRDNDTVECNDAATEIERRFDEHRTLAAYLCTFPQFKSDVLAGTLGESDLLSMGIDVQVTDATHVLLKVRAPL